MSCDLTSRLRRWVHDVNAVSASDLMEEAADMIEKLRRLSVPRRGCEHCGWFAARKDEQIGECHRYPPALPAAPGGESAWPMVHRENICGEFRHSKTGESFSDDPTQRMTAWIARLDDEVDRIKRSQ